MSDRLFDPVEQMPRAADRPHQIGRLLTQVEICRRLPVSVRTWRRWRAAHLVPAPVQNIPGRPRWREQDIETFERGLYRAGRRSFFTAGQRRRA